jgi:hypothetical protein
MATTIPEIDLFSQALRRATRDVEAFQQTLAQTPAASARAALTAEPEGATLQAAVFRPPAAAGQAMPQGEGAEVVPALAPAMPIAKRLVQMTGALNLLYVALDPLAQTTAKFNSELEKLQHQTGASATQTDEFGQATLKRSQELLQSPTALVDLFGKVNTLNLDKAELEKTDDKGNLALRLNTQEISDAFVKTAYVHNMAPGDLADMVMPLLRPVQENMTEVRVRLAQMNTIFNDAPLPDALMKSSFAPVVNRVEQFGVTSEQSIGSAASLLEIAKLRASDPAQAVKATEELFAQFNDADVRKAFKAKGIDIAALRQQAKNLKQDPLQLIAEAIGNGKFNQDDLDYELKSIMKEKQSAILLSDLVKNKNDYVAGRKTVTEDSKAENFAQAFEARSKTALGGYKAGSVGLETLGIQAGAVPMQEIGALKGDLSKLGNLSGAGIESSLQKYLKDLTDAIERGGEYLRSILPYLNPFGLRLGNISEPSGDTPPSILRASGPNLPSLQQANYSPSPLMLQASAPAALPAKAELTIHFTGLPSGVQAQVMSETEWFNIQTSMGYNCHSRGGLPPVPRSLRGRF